MELPARWSLDDWQPNDYYPGLTGSGVIPSPSAVLERWSLELEAMTREGGLFVLTMHPFVSGRPSRAEALERLIAHARSIDGPWIATDGLWIATDGLWIATCSEIAEHVERLDLSPVVLDRPVPLVD